MREIPDRALVENVDTLSESGENPPTGDPETASTSYERTTVGPDPRTTDRQLAMRIATGDREACNELVKRYHSDIYRMLVRLCRKVDDAEDLTQETFVACWSHAQDFRGQSSLATWLRQIAYHKFVDWRRRLRSRQPPGNVAELGKVVDTSAALPSEALQADEDVQRVIEALQNVESGSREIIVLHYQQGLTLREMSELLGQPLGTVKWRVSQALALLRDRLNAES